ncbi:MAG: phage recombination protein Bet [Coriobacteriales bacterium]|nr:phage recombination protein Bet [Coriobacteriales bacterium]
MAEERGLVTYEASDGVNVKLTPAIVQRYIVTGGQQVDDREVFSFMAKCQARGLNPLAGDAYMTAYKNKRTGRVETSVIVSKDYFVRVATQQPTFDGMRAGVIVASKKTGELSYREGSLVGKNSEALVGGWAEVYDKLRSHPSRSEVSLGEYDQHRSLWLSKPATMIRKVALVQALREAYPTAFAGVYDSSEMPESKQAVSVPEPEAPEMPAQEPEVAEPEPEPADDAEPAPDEDAPELAAEDYEF